MTIPSARAPSLTETQRIRSSLDSRAPPAAGLAIVEELTLDPALRSYHLLPAVRGDLLHKLRHFDEAALEFERAANLTRNLRERTSLLARAGACSQARSS